jgi:1,2-diacylglycerol 3-alpha-glucosyltransferase
MNRTGLASGSAADSDPAQNNKYAPEVAKIMTETDSTRLLIGQYTDSYLPTIDGVIMTVHNYARWLNEDHFSCYVATSKGPRGFADHETYPIIRYNSVPIAKNYTYRFGIPILDRKFIVSQHDLNPSLVHAHTPFSAGNEALRLARKLNIPLVASFHSKYYDDFLQTTRSRLIADTAVNLIVDFYNRADEVWTVNEGTARTLRDYGYKKSIVIMPNGTDFVFPPDVGQARANVEKRFGLRPDDKVMLYVGQLTYQKNLPLLIDAAALYARTGSPFKLLIVGDGYARPMLVEKTAELGLERQVIFAGLERDRARLSEIYLRADLFTFPSVYDNAPLVVREASMADCPSILIIGSNAAENASDGIDAFLCENSAESLSQTMERAMSDDALRRRIGTNARHKIGKPWREVIDKVAERYREIIIQGRIHHKRPKRHYTRRVKPGSSENGS